MGEYEPNDSRNVTGTASTQDGRWTGQAANDPTRQGQQQAQAGQGQGGQAAQQGFAEPFTQQEAAQAGQQGQQGGGSGQSIQFEPDPQLDREIGDGQQQAGQSGQQSAPQQNMGGSQGSVGQANDGIGGAASQGNDHTSAIGQNQSAGAAGSGQASYGNSGQGMSQAQQFQDRQGQFGGQQGGGAGRFADQIQPHQEVVGSNGEHVGTVDHVDGDRIKLAKSDSPSGEHRYVSLSQIEGIEGGRIRLSSAGDVSR